MTEPQMRSIHLKEEIQSDAWGQTWARWPVLQSQPLDFVAVWSWLSYLPFLSLFPYLYNEDHSIPPRPPTIILSWGLNELMETKGLEQCLEHGSPCRTTTARSLQSWDWRVRPRLVWGREPRWPLELLRGPIWKGYIPCDSNFMTFWKLWRQNYGDNNKIGDCLGLGE